MTPNAADDFTRAKGPETWLTPSRFALLLGLLIIATFPEVVAGLRAFCYSDAGEYAYPVAYFFRESFWHGELPLWNPYNSCGIPLLAQWNTMTLYPPSLFYLIFPLPWSYGVFCLGHLFLGGMGMYFLARKWSGNSLAGSLAGAVFAFNGLSWYAIMWPHAIAALGWMPWVVLAMERACREGGRSVVVAALASGMQLLSGGAEVVIFTWMFLGVWWLANLFRVEVSRGRMTVRILTAWAMAGGLAAAQLLPFADMLSHSQRNTGYGDSATASIAATGWANYLVPLFHCTLSPQGVPMFIHQINWTGSYYLGVVVVGLALLAVVGPGNLRTRMLAGLGLFSLVMALGGHALVYDWVKAVFPPLGFMRFPAKFVLLATFVIPLLAACGLGRLLAAAPENLRREWTRAGWIAAGLVALIMVIIGFALKHPLAHDDVGRTVDNALGRVLFFVLTAGCLFLLHKKHDWKWQGLLQTCVVVLCWLDVLTHAPDLSPTVAGAVWQPDTIRQFFKLDGQLRPGFSRAMETGDSISKLIVSGSRNPEVDINGRRLAMFMNYNLLDHLSKIDGYYPMDLNGCLRVCEGAYLNTNDAPGLEDFLGVAMVSDPANPVGWKTRNSFLPMVTAGQRPVFAAAEETFNALFSPGFKPQEVVYLPEELRNEVHATNAARAQISNIAVSNQHVTFEADADAQAMVLVAQSYYHLWRAYVDGQPTALWRANYAFQALEVPAGKHRVNLVYEDNAFVIGCVVSVISLLGCAALWFAQCPGRAHIPKSADFQNQ